MLNLYKKFAKTGIDLTLLGITILSFLFLFSYAYQIAAPIFIAIFIYLFVEPLSDFIHRKGLKKKNATNIAMFLFISILVGVIALLGVVIAAQVNALLISLPDYIHYLQDWFSKNSGLLLSKFNSIPPDILVKAEEFFASISGKISGLVTSALQGLLLAFSSITTLVFNFLVGIILAYFLSLEADEWKQFGETKLPKTIRNSLLFLKVHVLSGIGKYVKAQLKLISFTFIIIFLGLLFAGVENALTLAFFSAILDILPLLGIPVIFVPWIIYSYLTGKTGFAIFLLILLVFTMVFRQFMEPKIAGDSLGVSPFIMLSSMIVSLSVFGVGGLIITPILIILIKALIEQGYIRNWIHVPEDELKKDEN